VSENVGILLEEPQESDAIGGPQSSGLLAETLVLRPLADHPEGGIGAGRDSIERLESEVHVLVLDESAGEEDVEAVLGRGGLRTCATLGPFGMISMRSRDGPI
jgi:hypothetical protein